jgi:hypothetical protein
MCEPFTFLDKLGLSSQSHEVALDNQIGILFAEKERRSAIAGLGGAFRTSIKRHGGRHCW